MAATAIVMLVPAQDRLGARQREGSRCRICRAATRQAGSSPCVASPKQDLAPRHMQRQPHAHGRHQITSTVGNIRCCSSYVDWLEYRNESANHTLHT
jgi:hypothetical protein